MNTLTWIFLCPLYQKSVYCCKRKHHELTNCAKSKAASLRASLRAKALRLKALKRLLRLLTRRAAEGSFNTLHLSLMASLVSEIICNAFLSSCCRYH